MKVWGVFVNSFTNVHAMDRKWWGLGFVDLIKLYIGYYVLHGKYILFPYKHKNAWNVYVYYHYSLAITGDDVLLRNRSLLGKVSTGMQAMKRERCTTVEIWKYFYIYKRKTQPNVSLFISKFSFVNIQHFPCCRKNTFFIIDLNLVCSFSVSYKFISFISCAVIHCNLFSGNRVKGRGEERK